MQKSFAHEGNAQTIAIVGTGPAALMAADRLASSGCKVVLFEKRPAAAWKIFVAGSSGLNISNSLPLEAFASNYSGSAEHWKACLSRFSSADWVRFIEKDLGQKTFLGTSGRYFVETMHAAALVRAWRRRLEGMGVLFQFAHELVNFCADDQGHNLHFNKGRSHSFRTVILALGGGSYEREEEPLRWISIFQSKGLLFTEFSPVNTGYHVAWAKDLLAEADGLPLKNIALRNAKGTRKGDLIITQYGLEGTPIYTLGEAGEAFLDLKPDLSLDAIKQKLLSTKENYSLIRRAQKHLQLNKAALALLFHMGRPEWKSSIDDFVLAIKNFPLTLLQSRPLNESISARGGVAWENLDESLQLKAFPGIYLAGEMIDWEAPTGGFLIQGAVSQGRFVADSILQKL